MYILFFINDLTKWQCTPALSPRRGRNIRPCFGNKTELGCRVPPKRWTKKRELKPQRANFPAPCERSPSPRREGWGEGERSKLQPEADDDSRNCQTSRVRRQRPGVPNSLMTTARNTQDLIPTRRSLLSRRGTLRRSEELRPEWKQRHSY